MQTETIFIRYITLFFCFILCVIISCSHPTSSADGGGTRGGNPVITGKIVDTNGNAANDVTVSLLPADFNPVTETPPPRSEESTTDSKGIYTVTAPDTGRYTITAIQKSNGSRLLMFDVTAYPDSTTTAPDDTLHAPGTLELHLPEEEFYTDGYVYVPGTEIMAPISRTDDLLTIDSVPAETLPVLYYTGDNSTEQEVIRYDILIEPDQTTPVNNPQWRYSRGITLNTSPTGADMKDDLHNFPVLIRLTNDNFNFTQAGSDGTDLIVTGSTGTPLPLAIERWDTNGKQAEIWVTVDTIYGNDSSQSVTLYWGNGEMSAQTSRTAFDTADGFAGVWHLNDAAGDSVRDATVNNYNGIASGNARPEIAEGIIGNCRRFDGTDDMITMPGTADCRLNFPENGTYTVSAWVLIDSFNNVPQLIVSKGYEQYFLRSTYFPSDFPSWEFVEFHESDSWHSSRSTATGGEWVQIIGVRQGETQLLYVNGTLADSAADSWPVEAARDASNDLSIGAFLHEVTIPGNDGYCFFNGMIDEVRICDKARTSEWIRLSYMNQRSDDKLLQFR